MPIEPTVWLLLSLLALVAVAVTASYLEFDLKFSQWCRDLRPHHLREEVYKDCLSGRLDWVDVRWVKYTYVAGSTAAVLSIAGLVVCVTKIRLIAGQIVPPFVFDPIQRLADTDRYLAVLVAIIVVAIGLHAAPVVSSLVRKSRPSRSLPRVASDNPVLRWFLWLFACQQYLLDVALLHVFQYPRDASAGQSLASGNTKVSLIEHAFAEALQKEKNPDILNARLALIDAEVNQIPGGVGTVGKMAAMVAASENELPTAVPSPATEGKILTLIRHYGIPETRLRLAYRTKRKSVRRSIEAEISGDLGGEPFESAWLVDVGAPTEKPRRYESFLVKIPEGATAARIQAALRGRATIRSARFQGLGSFDCQLKRTDSASGTFYFACQVQDADLKRFRKFVRRIRRAEGRVQFVKWFRRT